MSRILIVEDSEDMRLVYRRLFRKEEGFEFADAEKGESAWEMLPTFKPDLLIIDISLPGISGLDLVRKVRDAYPLVKILVVTAHERERYYDEAIRAGADDLVTKNIGKGLVPKCKEMLHIYQES